MREDPRETILYLLNGYDVEVALEEMRIKYTEEQLHNMITYIQEHNLSIPYGEYMGPMIERAIEEGVMSVPFEPKELKEASLPLLNYLNKYYHPHCYAIVTEGRVEIVEGQEACPLPIRD